MSRSGHGVHGTRTFRQLLLLSILVQWDVGGSVAVAARVLDEGLQDDPIPSPVDGYNFRGRAESLGFAGLSTAGQETGHHTVLVDSEGNVFTQSHALSDDKGRSLAASTATTTPKPTSTNQGARLSPDMQCEGCPTTDTRVQVTATTDSPWSAVGRLTRRGQTAISSYVAQCTAALISDYHILTAAHCVVDTDNYNQTGNIQFAPAESGTILPYGILQVSYVRYLSQYTAQGSSVSPTSFDYDFSLLTLAKAAPSGATRMKIAAGKGTQTYDISTAGYPGDKASGTMWEVDCGDTQFNFDGSVLGASTMANVAVHHCVAYEGQSGSPLYDPTLTIRAILTGVITTSNGIVYNVGTQLDPYVYNTIAAWYNEDVQNGVFNGSSPTSTSPGNSTALPLSPVSSSSPPSSSTSNWVKDHLWYTLVPTIVGAVLLVSAVWCCFAHCATSRQPRQSRYPPQGTYAPPAGVTYSPAGPIAAYPVQLPNRGMPWSCPRCTYSNDGQVAVCRMCNTYPGVLSHSAGGNPTDPRVRAVETLPVELWPCPVCGMQNAIQGIRCCACSAYRPGYKPNAPPPDSNGGTPQEGTPRDGSLTPWAGGREGAGAWSCKHCTYSNARGATQCQMCGRSGDS